MTRRKPKKLILSKQNSGNTLSIIALAQPLHGASFLLALDDYLNSRRRAGHSSRTAWQY